jgi:uracil-DNA glycosylase family 4
MKRGHGAEPALAVQRGQDAEPLSAAERTLAAGPGPTASPAPAAEAGVAAGLAALERDVAGCRRCPRLVEWRERVAVEKRASFRDWAYWGRPVGGFGDPAARVLVLGLAPAAHGANRTGRVFTGDRSGDWLFAALHRTGFANQPTSVARDDGLALCDCWITAAVRCAPPENKPTPGERDACQPWTVEELRLLTDVRVCVCLGGFAWDAALRLRAALGAPPARPKPRFGHNVLWDADPWPLLGCFHPSQQNTFTGRLTETMTDDVLLRARDVAGLPVTG